MNYDAKNAVILRDGKPIEKSTLGALYGEVKRVDRQLAFAEMQIVKSRQRVSILEQKRELLEKEIGTRHAILELEQIVKSLTK